MTDQTIKVSEISKIDLDEGNILVISLPEHTIDLPSSVLARISKDLHDTFNEVIGDKNIDIIIVPYGLGMQIMHSSKLKDLAL